VVRWRSSSHVAHLQLFVLLQATVLTRRDGGRGGHCIVVVTDETGQSSTVCSAVLVLVEKLFLQQCGGQARHRTLHIRKLRIILSSSLGRLHGREIYLSSLKDLIAEVGRFAVSVEADATAVLCHRLLQLHLLRPHSLIKVLQRRLHLLPERHLVRGWPDR